MKNFQSVEQLVNAKATQSLKAYAYDQPESIDWTISGLRKEIEKERKYQAKKLAIAVHSHTANLNNVPVKSTFIPNFGFTV